MLILKKGSICPVCEKGKLIENKKDLIFNYKNKSKKFENETVYECDLCGDQILPKGVEAKIEKELTDFRRGIDGLLSSSQLKEIRKNLSLNISQMAKLLSLNEKSVGRYENGKLTQSAQVDKLYRILQVIPSAATILRPDIGTPIASFKGFVIVEKIKYVPKPAYTFAVKNVGYFESDQYKDASGY